MAVPAYSELMLPLLQYASDGKEHHIRDAVQPIAEYLELSEEDLN
ncbi:MAG: restriction endonuclease, partial [Phototrophicales bacterium]